MSLLWNTGAGASLCFCSPCITPDTTFSTFPLPYLLSSRSVISDCDSKDCSTPDFPVLHHLLEFAQIHVHWVGNGIQPSRPLSSPSPAFSRSRIKTFSNELALCQLESGSQNLGASASASALPMNIPHWFPLGLTGLILQSKGLARVFSNTTVQKYQFFGTQLSL